MNDPRFKPPASGPSFDTCTRATQNSVPFTADTVARQSLNIPHRPLPADQSRELFRSLFGLLAGYALLMGGNGLFGTLIPLRMLHANLSTLAVGLVQSCYYGGFACGAIFNARLIERIGQHRAFVAFAAAATVLALAFGTSDSPWVWALLRFGSGFALMGIFAAVESWINGAVPNGIRGRVFASYLATGYLGMAIGQFLVQLTEGDVSSDHQLLIVAGLFVVAILPVTLLEGWPVHVSDNLHARQPRTWLESAQELARGTPLAIPCCVCAGFLSSSFYTMMPVFLTRIGFSIGDLSRLMGITLIGALIAQWPVGKFSDRIDRRLLVFRVAAASAMLSVTLIVIHAHWFVSVATFLYVALTFTEYGLIVSHVNDHIAPERRIETSATLLILFSIGGLLGPTIASLLMTVFGASGLFVFNGATAAVLAYAARSALRRL